ncbi:hypothetical protein [Pendulispora albinea]|uniref:Uncharacterized protein n=1 Tax=Pendulispora albinea TaxID=2741071 RepID=A0ABZ2M617_9BACT
MDVTIIYPLPAAGEQSALLGPMDTGGRGPLLPRTVFEQEHVPDLDELQSVPTDTEREASLRALAMRFDPCPRVTMPPPAGTSCQPELRIIFQSLRRDGAATATRDGAIHAFYKLTPAAWEEILRELRAIRAEQASAPEVRLDVHPLLRAQGPGGAYANRLKALVVKHAGEQNLVRVTQFRRIPSESARWVFSIRELERGRWQNATIPTLAGATEVSLYTLAGGRWDAELNPRADPALDTTRIFKVSTPAEEREAFRSVVRALNPRLHSSESIDCASCHIAPDVSVFAKSTGRASEGDYPERFQSRYSLDAAHKSVDEAIGFENLHMLSYSGTSLSVSHRVANETAAVLELLNGS